MSTDPKSPKPTPSAAEINAYLELSAARTKLRLPLAKGAASGGVAAAPNAAIANPAPPVARRPLPLSVSKKLPIEREATSANEAGHRAPNDRHADEPSEEAWRPFSSDDER